MTHAVPRQFLDACRASLGPSGVIEDPNEVAPYAVDFWRQHRGVAGAVLRPATTAEVAAAVTLAAQHEVALVPQGGNTGLVRGGIPDESGGQVVVSLERLDRIRRVSEAGDHLVAEAGCLLAQVQHAAAAVGRLFPLSLGAEGSCRIGGNLSTNAGGVNVLRYGMARDLVLGLEVVLADGRVWSRLSPLRKDNTGYDLKQLFIGAEGTLGIITAASLKLVSAPRERVTLWLGIESPARAVELLHRFQTELGDLVTSFELLTQFGVNAAAEQLPGVRRPLAGNHPWHLLIEAAWAFTDGLRDRVEAVVAEALAQGQIGDGTIAASEAQRAMFWRIREGQSEATRHMGYIVRSDVTVAIADLPRLIARMAAWVAGQVPDVLLLPFGHVGDGNLHFNFVAPPAAADRLRPLLLERLYDEVTQLGGSISAEHGIGRLKRDELARRKPALDLELMRRLKSVLDPQGLMNPGAVL